MANPGVTDEQKREAVEAYETHGSYRKAARALGMPPATFKNRLERAQLDPAISSGMAAVGTGMVPRLAWAKTSVPDENGLTYSFMLKPDPASDDVVGRIRDAVADIPAASRIKAPKNTNADLLTLYPIADAHIGMMAWGRETGEDYDTAKATARVRDWVAQCVDASPPSDTAIVLGVGDLLHADDQTNQTPRSKHALDVDTRHFKTIDVTIAAIGGTIESAKVKHKTVIVRILPGNHDMHSYMAILFAIAERYRRDPRVIVQKEPGEFFAHEFGDVLIAAHHGDKSKPERMVLFLADQYPELWGRTRFRFLFTGHLHHHKSQDIGGVTHEQLCAITARDAYAVTHAYSARAQMQGITYHRTRGEVSRVKVSA